MHQLKYNSRICVFVFSIFPTFPSHWFTDSVFNSLCYVQYFAPTLRVKVFAHTDTAYNIRCTCTVHTVIVHLHRLLYFVSISLLLYCNRSVHNFDLGLNWGGGGLIWKFYCNLKNSGGGGLSPQSPIVTSPMTVQYTVQFT